MVRSDTSRIAIQVTRGVVVASIQIDLDEDVMARFQDDLLEQLRVSEASGVVLDVSGLDTLDATEFAALRRLVKMASLMGARSIFAGLQPGVVAGLLDSEADVDGVDATRDLDAALQQLAADIPAADAAPEEDATEEPAGEETDPADNWEPV